MARPRYTREVSSSTGFKSDFKNEKGAAARDIPQEEYAAVLGKTLLKEGQRIFPHPGMSSWVLQQDNDPARFKAGKIIADCNKGEMGSRIELLPDWPGNSPDLSLIENLWAYVDAEVAKKGCKTFQEFKAAVNSTLTTIPRSMCQKLTASLSKDDQVC